MLRNFKRIWLIPIVLILGIGVYFLPPVHSRISSRVDDLRAQIKYYLNPPDQAVFQPAQSQQEAIDAIVKRYHAGVYPFPDPFRDFQAGAHVCQFKRGAYQHACALAGLGLAPGCDLHGSAWRLEFVRAHQPDHVP